MGSLGFVYSMIRRATRITGSTHCLARGKEATCGNGRATLCGGTCTKTVSNFEEFIKNCTGQVKLEEGALYSLPTINWIIWRTETEYSGRLYREVRKFSRRPAHLSDEGGDSVRADYACQRFGPPALQHLLHIGAREDRQRTIRKRHRVFWI